MEYSVTRLIGLGVALALVAALSVVVWNIMGSRAPATGATSSAAGEMAQIPTYALCKAAGGTKTLQGDRSTATADSAGNPTTTVAGTFPSTIAPTETIPATHFCSR